MGVCDLSILCIENESMRVRYSCRFFVPSVFGLFFRLLSLLKHLERPHQLLLLAVRIFKRITGIFRQDLAVHIHEFSPH
jgi:hypothetical protein